MPLKVLHRALRQDLSDREKSAVLATLVLTKTAPSEHGCWEWYGARNRLGYGQLTFQNIKWMAHRLSWVLTQGPIPETLFVCHRCDNPCCIRPDHLFVATHTDNQRDMVRKGRHVAQKAVCKHGHDFTPENTGWYTDCHGSTHRRCKACEKARKWVSTEWTRKRQRLYRARKKAERLQSTVSALHKDP